MRGKLAIAGVLLAVLALVVVAVGAKGGSSGGSYKVRAIFDNATFVIPGEEVKIAGAKVGKVDSLGVTKDKKAAITLDISTPGFDDFRKDAHCTIRPESLIGERFVECTPTVPKAPGQRQAAKLKKIPDGQTGAGSYYLPVQNTSTPVDVDLIADSMRLPYRQRLSLIIDELGTGLAANGSELSNVIHRANPALGELDKVLAIVAKQNQVLANLARDSDQALAPLARDRHRVADFVDQAGQVAQATAERRGDLEANIQRLPTFLAELRKTVPRINGLADEAIPVLNDLHTHSTSINNLVEELGPFSSASRPAVRALGKAAKIGGPALVKTLPLTHQLNTLAVNLRPVAHNAARLLTSLRNTGGIERAMDYIFYQAMAVNGEDAFGHYLRAGLITQGVAQCSIYRGSAGSTTGQRVLPDGTCTANFPGAGTASTRASVAQETSTSSDTDPTLAELAKILQVDAARQKAGKHGLTPRQAAKMWAASPAADYGAKGTAKPTQAQLRAASAAASSSSSSSSSSSGTAGSSGAASGGTAATSPAAKDPSVGLLNYLLGGSSK